MTVKAAQIGEPIREVIVTPQTLPIPQKLDPFPFPSTSPAPAPAKEAPATPERELVPA